MPIEEFEARIKEIHEKLNDAFTAIQAIPVGYAFMDQKAAAKNSVIEARRSLDAAGLAHSSIG